MFFVLSKVLGFFALPSNLLCAIGLAGLLLLPTRFARSGRWLLAASVLLLALAGLSPLGNALMLPLEQRFPPWDAARGAPDGIIVLGGSINPELSAARGDHALNESAERLVALAELARRYPGARIVFSGGDASLSGDGLPEAKLVGELLDRIGIPPQRVELEDRSRSTAENAAFTQALVNPKPGERWLLVTSAHHMPRAVGSFRRVGFAVEAYPVDWRTRGWSDLSEPSPAVSAGLARTDAAAREWAGLAAYWLSGRTSALWPAP